MKKMIVAMLFAVLFTGCGSKDEAVTDNVADEAAERVVNVGGVDIVRDASFQEKRWVVLADNPDDYMRNYRAWSSDKNIVPEVDTAIVEWIEGEETAIERIIINTPTRATYRVDGSKWSGGAKVRIVYMGKAK